jgi:glucosamine kinase
MRPKVVLERYQPIGAFLRLCKSAMMGTRLYLAVDGGGTRCRAQLCDAAGARLSVGEGGPANLRLGLERAFASVDQAVLGCLYQADLKLRDLSRIAACLALAGATEPAERAAAERRPHGFERMILVADAHAACVGAHNGADGAVVIAGTGSIGWAIIRRQTYRIGGWGSELSDEGSGAWLGREALRRVLLAHDGRIPWTALLRQIFERHDADPHAIVRWAAAAQPRDYGSLAPIVLEHAAQHDDCALALVRLAASFLENIALRLVALGAPRIALAGGLAPYLKEYLSDAVREQIVAPIGDALDGALLMAREATRSAAA